MNRWVAEFRHSAFRAARWDARLILLGDRRPPRNARRQSAREVAAAKRLREDFFIPQRGASAVTVPRLIDEDSGGGDQVLSFTGAFGAIRWTSLMPSSAPGSVL
jgi:hypothetical protein